MRRLLNIRPQNSYIDLQGPQSGGGGVLEKLAYGSAEPGAQSAHAWDHRPSGGGCERSCPSRAIGVRLYNLHRKCLGLQVHVSEFWCILDTQNNSLTNLVGWYFAYRIFM